MLRTPVDTLALEQRHTSGAYAKRAIEIVRGEGAYLFDADGNRYIDCVSRSAPRTSATRTRRL